ncbi:MAG TPA: TetR/AcrR family transcriptional regulator [Phycisphaerae bacterium]|nr:TetR/AcrR family transcriptional regulator [Phycisphaerae bacterium]HRY70043.1 TetR/AcrR family transcriptional regulator [Phycisphaerae bacterium]HSA27319.1 TetR/AcrR family transcriptional regulator [Phycisphaerae bacterium]
MKSTTPAHPYRQTARAESAAATGRRIVEAFLERLGEQWYDEITLDWVADEAGVTVQTVVRRFGGKAGLLGEAIREMVRRAKKRRAAPPGDLERLVRNWVDDYERTGDTIIRLLAVEGRHAGLHEHLTHARRRHRAGIARAFADDLGLLEASSRQSALDALVIATDVCTWKLLRRDMGRAVAGTRAAITGMIRSTLAAHQSAQKINDSRKRGLGQ